MSKKRLPRSVRKYIRREKAKIRRMFSSPEEVEQKIRELSANFFKMFLIELRHAPMLGVLEYMHPK